MIDALVIVDVQEGMFSVPGVAIYKSASVISNIQLLLERARSAGTTVIFIQHKGGKGHPLEESLEGFAIHAALTPRPNESIVVKQHCGSFKNTDLDKQLRNAGIEKLIICGLQSEYCVDTAVRTASDRGYDVVLVKDAHTTADRPNLSAKAIINHHNDILDGAFCSVQNTAGINFGA